MEKEVFDLWLQYLRSGVYKRARFRLVDNNSRFSPIGVLADLLSKEFSCGRWINIDETYDDKPIIYKYGWCWKYRPENMEIINGEHVNVLADEYVKYRVYLPLKQWFWPGATFALQDTIYSWSDHYNYSYSKISDLLEDGKHYQ